LKALAITTVCVLACGSAQAQSLRVAGAAVAVSPGTGAQFAILPPQNASGNWVKVVQRVPVRIAFEQGQDMSKLRSGMSVTVDIDTRRRRGLGSLFGNDVANAKDGE
jgi:membrane fusion protein (multidrug efflux system)